MASNERLLLFLPKTSLGLVDASPGLVDASLGLVGASLGLVIGGSPSSTSL